SQGCDSSVDRRILWTASLRHSIANGWNRSPNNQWKNSTPGLPGRLLERNFEVRSDGLRLPSCDTHAKDVLKSTTTCLLSNVKVEDKFLRCTAAAGLEEMKCPR